MESTPENLCSWPVSDVLDRIGPIGLSVSRNYPVFALLLGGISSILSYWINVGTGTKIPELAEPPGPMVSTAGMSCPLHSEGEGFWSGGSVLSFFRG